MNLDDIEELAIVRDLQPNDLLIITVPANMGADAAHRLGQTIQATIGCKFIIKTTDIEIASSSVPQ